MDGAVSIPEKARVTLPRFAFFRRNELDSSNGENQVKSNLPRIDERATAIPTLISFLPLLTVSLLLFFLSSFLLFFFTRDSWTAQR